MFYPDLVIDVIKEISNSAHRRNLLRVGITNMEKDDQTISFNKIWIQIFFTINLMQCTMDIY